MGTYWLRQGHYVLYLKWRANSLKGRSLISVNNIKNVVAAKVEGVIAAVKAVVAPEYAFAYNLA